MLEGVDIVAWLASDNGYAVQVGLFALLLLGGIGLPIPEDIVLLLGGVAIANHIVHLDTAFVICYVGVMIGDQTMYLFGRSFGQKILNAGTRSPWLPRLTEEKLGEVREGLRRKRLLYIFVARHLFPIRSLTFVSAGALHVPFLEFFIADAFAALVSVTLMMALGYWLGRFLTAEQVEVLAHEANVIIFAVVTLILLVWGLCYLRRRQLRKALSKAAESVNLLSSSVNK